MSLVRAFWYACLLLASSALFILIIQLMSWTIIWITTRFPGAFGAVVLILVALVTMTIGIYVGQRLLTKKYTRNQ